MATATAATGHAARVVTSVADTIQDAPADAEAQRALRSLAEAHQAVELRAHQLETRLMDLAEGEASDDAALELLKERVTKLESQGATLRTFGGILRTFSQRLDSLDRLLGAAASAGSFRQLGDQEEPRASGLGWVEGGDGRGRIVPLPDHSREG
jgi:Rad3-related DNA helicase